MSIPDEHIQPHATGAAAKTVEQHQEPQEVVFYSGWGLVPALEYRGKALYESLVLCEFLEDLYPSKAPHILPQDPYDRAHREAKRGSEGPYDGLAQLSQKRKGPYFLGEELSLVDVAIAPWAVRDYIIAENRGYKRTEVSDAWSEWASILEKRESISKTTSDKEHYAEIYGRYLRNEAQSEAAKATRAGRVIP
ncbi:uncharacterized protein FOMMEDRAFT_136787 [Fomitiporia mediterranea MF3/22]|uniref:uncharacterized protein n=1 Tax=Fomitiporia mediterranea (strain MF3/22) TaxID=694068 RepID=UPI0004409C28|nr:uncharacterized protein FOMMEDRAFT_136787 [Fomitiporia mediterranea MF3/22]EJC99033.1 hypothetical protein FOMMEDRAFT_136787 [Fomitiporia mediterranea MF3/22]